MKISSLQAGGVETELISLKTLSNESKVSLLRNLGYDSDGIYVLDECGRRVIDKYVSEPVKIDNMLILPGSTIVLDNNPISVACYFEEYDEII